MKLKHLFTINAVISLLYGLGEVLTPAAMLTTYGFPTGPVEKLLAQYFGMALLGLGMLIWTMKHFRSQIAKGIYDLFITFKYSRRCFGAYPYPWRNH